jgi:hypothetical protein
VPVLFFMFLIMVGVMVVGGLSLAAIVWGVGAVAVALLRDAPWVLILLGIWMLWAPRRRRHRRGRDVASAPVAAARPVATPSPAPASAPVATATPKRELPIDVRVKVEQIRHKADVLLGYADRFPPFSHDLHVVRQTAADYLPRTVEAYLALPGQDDPKVGERSALDELKEQLNLLDGKLDEVAGNLQQQDLDRMLANRRFLEERFRAADDAA